MPMATTDGSGASHHHDDDRRGEIHSSNVPAAGVVRATSKPTAPHACAASVTVTDDSAPCFQTPCMHEVGVAMEVDAVTIHAEGLAVGRLVAVPNTANAPLKPCAK